MCLFVFPSLAVEFLWSHTTESMCVGYMSAQDGKAKVSGESWVGEGRRGGRGMSRRAYRQRGNLQLARWTQGIFFSFSWVVALWSLWESDKEQSPIPKKNSRSFFAFDDGAEEIRKNLFFFFSTLFFFVVNKKKLGLGKRKWVMGWWGWVVLWGGWEDLKEAEAELAQHLDAPCPCEGRGSHACARAACLVLRVVWHGILRAGPKVCTPCGPRPAVPQGLQRGREAHAAPLELPGLPALTAGEPGSQKHHLWIYIIPASCSCS